MPKKDKSELLRTIRRECAMLGIAVTNVPNEELELCVLTLAKSLHSIGVAAQQAAESLRLVISAEAAKSLIPLCEWNDRRRDWQCELEPQPNGIACPKCGGELCDSPPNMALLRNPPQRRILCRKCGYEGFRVL